MAQQCHQVVTVMYCRSRVTELRRKQAYIPYSDRETEDTPVSSEQTGGKVGPDVKRAEALKFSEGLCMPGSGLGRHRPQGKTPWSAATGQNKFVDGAMVYW